MGQTKNFLQEFKAKYYGDYIQTKLEDAEKRAYKASKEHQKYVATTIKLKSKLARDPGNSEVKNAYLEALAAESKKEEGLKKIQSEIEFLKKTLFNYIQKST